MRRLWTYQLFNVNVAGTWLLSDMQIPVLRPPEPADWSLTGLRGAQRQVPTEEIGLSVV